MKDVDQISIETEVGPIRVAIETFRSPVTASNFLRYVDEKYYDGGLFHRTVRLNNQPNDPLRIEVVQAGIDPNREDERFPPIELERTTQTGLQHLDGTISMARSTPDSAVSDFFICIGNQPSLDFGGQRNPDGQGFAAFGQVVSGMEIVKRIQMAPAQRQQLAPPIRIQSIHRI